MNLSIKYTAVAAMALMLLSCKKDEKLVALKNDVLKKTTGPAIAGESIEFVYALATTNGKLQKATVQASVAGAAGTGFSNQAWYTDRNTGTDRSVTALKDSSTSGTLSSGTIVDTNAVSLRYFYVVPAAAKGQTVQFTFSGSSNTGEQVSMTTTSYRISKMDMKRSITLADGGRAYFSMADGAAYTKAEVETGNLSGKIDFVYIYRATLGSGNYAFGHALVALNNTQYINDLAIPAAWTKPASLIDRRVDVRDGQLKGDQFLNQYIDDTDLQNTTFPNAANYGYGFAADQGAFVKATDGTVAYVYVNSVNNTAKTMTVSVKKLKP